MKHIIHSLQYNMVTEKVTTRQRQQGIELYIIILTGWLYFQMAVLSVIQ